MRNICFQTFEFLKTQLFYFLCLQVISPTRVAETRSLNTVNNQPPPIPSHQNLQPAVPPHQNQQQKPKADVQLPTQINTRQQQIAPVQPNNHKLNHQPNQHHNFQKSPQRNHQAQHNHQTNHAQQNNPVPNTLQNHRPPQQNLQQIQQNLQQFNINQLNQQNQLPFEKEQRRKFRVERKLQELEEKKEVPESEMYHDIVEFATNYFNNHERSPEGTIMATLTRKSRGSKNLEFLPKYEMVTYSKGNTIPNSHILLYDPDNVNVACNIFRVSVNPIYLHVHCYIKNSFAFFFGKNLSVFVMDLIQYICLKQLQQTQ